MVHFLRLLLLGLQILGVVGVVAMATLHLLVQQAAPA
jgi:predicted nucleic acid-binding protein